MGSAVMTKKQVDSRVVTDDIWQRGEPLISVREQGGDKAYVRKPDAEGRPKPARQVVKALVFE